MRAPVQKKRPRRTGRHTASEGGAERTPVGTGRPTHVRNRLIVAVAVVAAAIAGAGAPSVVAASGQVNDSQELVTLAGRTQDALALAHSLADERDEVTSYVASGRPQGMTPSPARGARVDRQVDDLRANTDAPASLRKALDRIAAVRRDALSGKSSALQTHQAYSGIITGLHGLAVELAAKMSPRSGAGAYALADLDSAVQQSAAARGLLLAALRTPVTGQAAAGLPGAPATTGPKERDALTAAAQQARLRADTALADFRDTAPKSAVASYDSTVTGADVNSAEKYLTALTAQPTLSAAGAAVSARKLDPILSGRIDLMRGVEISLYDHRTKELAGLRDDDVTALEIRIAVLGVLMLVAVGISTAMARTLTQPLSVLRRGTARLAESADPLSEEPVRFTGRNDEFAQVVRSVNALHAYAVELHERVAPLHERIATLESDRKHMVAQRQQMADAREELRAELADARAQLETMRTSIGGTFVSLALRNLGLVERQLAVIESLEEREHDPERLATLYKLDHFATVMRRHSENLLVLTGTEQLQQHPRPVPLIDVVRAAVSEVERYERVRISALPPHAHVAGFVADDLSHLMAELMENAAAFSPPDVAVEVSGWLLESGEIMLSVQDEGIGMTQERMGRLNHRLTHFDPEATYDQEGGDGLGLGLYVVARLAHRHGARVQLREQKQGGVAAVVVLPQSLLAQPPTAVGSTSEGGAYALTGADAEANSNALSGRAGNEDLLVALAEKAVKAAGDSALRDPQPAAPAYEPAYEPAVPAARHAAPATPHAAPETPAESTMELRFPESGTDPYAIGPDAHERTPDARVAPPAPQAPVTPQASEAPAAAGEDAQTDKGLPKRTPKITAPAQAPRQRTGSVDAEALRRRLGGFHRGAAAGQRDVQAEIAAETARNPLPHAAPHDAGASGGTVEEASS
ncbi:nitrate- and nitrite sensing domain-containing protein [Streptomyces sp. NPDC046805]|uniref:sensor histidine kinase n=1 Tax=Streptomyces sp. NPDC046805 TaxID=3155134 RepID=UPI0033F142FF